MSPQPVKGRKKSIRFPVGDAFIIIVSFLLAILDMIFLYKALQNIIPSLSRFMAMAVALILATVANFTALMWGRANGEYAQEKTLNKHSIGFFLGWFTIGLIYAGIRAWNIANMVRGMSPDTDILKMVGGEIAQIVILAVSYIGTGTLIAQSAARIWQREIKFARKEKKEFDILHNELGRQSAEIDKLADVLNNFGEVYSSLDSQYTEIREGVFQSEKSSMYNVVGKIIKNNPGINVDLMHKAMNEFLEERENEKK